MNLYNLITAVIKTYWMLMQITEGISNHTYHLWVSFFDLVFFLSFYK